ncbi:Protein of unknown function [Actinacidiphila guanduensis]|uniref:DUF2752 domain-containing protein n=2 Tax=Actinacidiphila guanduensis TaxID=310781 RepID=A0A1H0P0W9_9ACTN|nr:DUF2752 domain-containing protein [Actinacidiphila guanduensis]SDO98563.1 Protein of unknown function [Actinacidiphila guanduensis]
MPERHPYEGRRWYAAPPGTAPSAAADTEHPAPMGAGPGHKGVHPALAPLATLAVGAAMAMYLYRTDPHQPGHLFPRCPFNWLTGQLCPVCGSTRLAYDLLHGEPVRAFHENALVLALTPLLAWASVRWLLAGLRGRRWKPAVPPRAQYALLGAAVVWTVVRNVW